MGRRLSVCFLAIIRKYSNKSGMSGKFVITLLGYLNVLSEEESRGEGEGRGNSLLHVC